jgi:hypothetical protein
MNYTFEDKFEEINDLLKRNRIIIKAYWNFYVIGILFSVQPF